jgi:hypothetical protein
MTKIITVIGLLTILTTAARADEPTPPTAVSTSSPATGGAENLKGPSVWGILPWGGLGFGGRMMFPLGIQGVVHAPNIHDTFAIEAGADLLHWSYDYGVPGPGGGTYSWTEILAVGGIMWNFWFNDRFALYPKVELGYAFGWFSGFEYAGRPSYGGFFISGDAGGIYKLNNGLSLRAEVGSDGLKAGVGWLF